MKLALTFLLALAAAPFAASQQDKLDCGANIQADHCGDCLEVAGASVPASCGGDCMWNEEHAMCFPATFADSASYTLALQLMCQDGIPEQDGGVAEAAELTGFQLDIIAATNTSRRELNIYPCESYYSTICIGHQNVQGCQGIIGEGNCYRRRDLLEKEVNMKEVHMEEGKRDLSSHSQEVTPTQLCRDVISEFEGILKRTMDDPADVNFIMNPDHCTISCFMFYDVEE